MIMMCGDDKNVVKKAVVWNMACILKGQPSQVRLVTLAMQCLAM